MVSIGLAKTVWTFIFSQEGAGSNVMTIVMPMAVVLNIILGWGRHCSVESMPPQYCGHRFKSQAHHLCFFHLSSNFVLCLSLSWEKDKNSKGPGSA